MRIYPEIVLSKKITMAAALFVIIGFALPAMALSPPMEADRLLISAAKHLGSSAATAEFEKIQILNIKLPAEYYYYYGKHLYTIGNLKEANKNIEKYLRKAGYKGLFYKDALQVMKDTRFIDNRDGTVTDTKTGLMWATRDNGSNIYWEKAGTYCWNYSGGGYTDWRLPGREELAGLYAPGKRKRDGYNNICELINISSCSLWASEFRSNSEGDDFDSGAYFDFVRGYWGWKSKLYFYDFRVLPVRSGKWAADKTAYY